jgi:hypothetical protein
VSIVYADPPTFDLFEFVGKRFAGGRFLVSLTPAARIIFGVIVLGGFVLLVLVTFHFLEPFLTKWGS